MIEIQNNFNLLNRVNLPIFILYKKKKKNNFAENSQNTKGYVIKPSHISSLSYPILRTYSSNFPIQINLMI